MQCSACASEVSDNARFCHICGGSIGQSALRGGSLVNRQRAPLPEQARVAFLGAGLLLLAGLGYFAYVTHRIPKTGSAINFVDRLTKKEHTLPLANRSLTINQLGYSYFQLDVPAKASSVALEGTFTASGAGGNTIEAFVFSENDYENWQKQQGANPFYSSGRVSMGKIDASLPPGPGTYYLVFNNKFSVVNPKMVRLDAALNYYQ